MRRTLAIVALTAGSVVMGYVIGRAQPIGPAFEFVVDAPSGVTTVRCVKGCALAWVERGVNPNAKPVPEFQFSCSTGSGPCSSARIGGWLQP
jgi:hypothetical protein